MRLQCNKLLLPFCLLIQQLLVFVSFPANVSLLSHQAPLVLLRGKLPAEGLEHKLQSGVGEIWGKWN
jgi:hypothetical protein